MSNRADEVRKRIAKRKREQQFRSSHNTIKPHFLSEEEKYGQSPFPTSSGGIQHELHPLFRKETFIFKLLISTCLVLIVAILFRNHSPQFESARNIVKKTMHQEFQFAAVSTWYEENFGKPLALFPTNEGKNKIIARNEDYSVPASGKVLENFATNGQGIMVETSNNASVDAVKEGTVIYAGKKDNIGKTVIIQHTDGTETWYGNLQSISVMLYDFVEKGKEVGKVTDFDNKKKGQYYFAIKKGDHFIDPSQVISFD